MLKQFLSSLKSAKILIDIPKRCVISEICKKKKKYPNFFGLVLTIFWGGWELRQRSIATVKRRRVPQNISPYKGVVQRIS